jgi:hypothetical protein
VIPVETLNEWRSLAEKVNAPPREPAGYNCLGEMDARNEILKRLANEAVPQLLAALEEAGPTPIPFGTSSWRAGSFVVSSDLLASVLNIPDGYHIVGSEWEFSCRGIRLFVTGEDMPVVQEGCRVPELFPTITQRNGVLEGCTVEWNWNLPATGEAQQ